MNNMEYKERLLSSGMFRKRSGERYTCQCPFCNDNKRHMYVLISLEDIDSPIVYICFKCQSQGIVDKSFLEYLGISDIRPPRRKDGYRKRVVGDNGVSDNIGNGLTVVEEDDIDGVCGYIESRVGVYPSLGELQAFQYVGNARGYVNTYLDTGLIGNVDRYLMNRYWFRLNNGLITGRYMNNDRKTWLTYKSNMNKPGLYVIKFPFDLYRDINVYIVEGVFDAIGLYYGYQKENNIYIAVRGRNYAKGIKYLIDKGIFGDTVCVKICKDGDVDADKIHLDMNMCQLFKSVDIYGNTVSHDYGVSVDKLNICKFKNIWRV